MAQRVVVELTDDLDGSGAVSTVIFGLDGKSYEIDLNEKNEAKLRKALEPFLQNSRRVTGSGRKPRSSASTAKSRSTEDVRAWAAANGHQVSARGRIARSVLDAYDAAHS
jgi:uncharacterized membrane protein